MAVKTPTPFAELLPPLSTEEFSALSASINAEGVKIPVVVDEHGNVLDGIHRLKIDPKAPRRIVKGLSEAEKQAFVFQANFNRRNLSPSQKKEAAAKMKVIANALRKENDKKNTNEHVGMLLGVSDETISRWQRTRTNSHVGNASKPDARVKVNPSQHPEIIKRVEAGESQAQVAADYSVSQRAVSTIVAKETKQRVKAAAREKTAAAIKSDDLGIWHGDFRNLGDKVANESVDLIFTDPPYHEATTELYSSLGDFAGRVLKPGGWCLSYAGQFFLPQVINALSQRLTYGWCFAIQHSGGDLRIRKFKIHNAWKPILGFYKPPLDCWWQWFKDSASGGKEKTSHEWQQAIGEAKHFIAALCPKKGIVCDPMCGSGTSLLALGFCNLGIQDHLG